MTLRSLCFWAIAPVVAGSACAGADDSGNTFGPGLGGSQSETAPTSPTSPTNPTTSPSDGSGDGGPGTSGPATDSSASDPTEASDDDPTLDPDTDGPGCAGDPDCDDGNDCTDDVCDLGTCLNATRNCDDDIACTNDSCNPVGGCVNDPDDSQCSNGDACDGAETCVELVGCQVGTPVVCNDNDTCTDNVCDSSNGSCSYPELSACNSGDGCCPAGCSAGVDNDCVCTNNAPGATGSVSDGSTSPADYGPVKWTDGVNETTCVNTLNCIACYGWVNNGQVPEMDFMQLDWASQQVIGSMYIETSNAFSGACSSTANRNLEDGDVQYWNGAAWVTATSFSNQQGDLSFDFNPPLQTDSVRLYNITATPTGDNSLIFEWFVYEPLGCAP